MGIQDETQILSLWMTEPWLSGNTGVNYSAGGEFFPKFLSGQPQTAFGGWQVGFHRFSHFRQAQSRINMQDKRQSLVFRNIVQHVVHQLGDLTPFELLVWQWQFTGQSGNHFLPIFITILPPGGVNQAVVGAPTRGINQQISGDPVHPGFEDSARKVIPGGSMNAQQRFLRQVLGQLPVPQLSMEEANQRRLMARNQLLKGGFIATLQSQHQIVVFIVHCGVVGQMEESDIPGNIHNVMDSTGNDYRQMGQG